jgi:hypothetical protein
MKNKTCTDICFIIQPFDNGGVFDKRFKDIFEPAILKANLLPYRIDNDLNVNVPIDEIEKSIKKSVICFAEITTNNPNVWYELGYAFACNKSVVMVCANKRKLPFNIQHRHVIFYSTDSKSDYEMLKEQISQKIILLLKKVNRRFLRPKSNTEWLAKSDNTNPQSACFQELLYGYQFEHFLCRIKTACEYFRFGFKLLEKHGDIFGDAVIKSEKYKNYIIHIGKDIHLPDVFITLYLNGRRVQDNKPIFKFKKNRWISIKMNIDKENILKFYLNSNLCYETVIDPDIKQRLIMYAWGDEHKIEILVDEIEIKGK